MKKFNIANIFIIFILIFIIGCTGTNGTTGGSSEYSSAISSLPDKTSESQNSTTGNASKQSALSAADSYTSMPSSSNTVSNVENTGQKNEGFSLSSLLFAKNKKVYILDINTDQLKYVANINYDFDYGDNFPKLLTDGTYLYFSQYDGVDYNFDKPTNLRNIYRTKPGSFINEKISVCNDDILGFDNGSLYYSDLKSTDGSFYTEDVLKLDKNCSVVPYFSSKTTVASICFQAGVLYYNTYDEFRELHRFYQGTTELIEHGEEQVYDYTNLVQVGSDLFYSRLSRGKTDGLIYNEIIKYNIQTKNGQVIYKSEGKQFSAKYDQTFKFLVYNGNIFYSNGADGTFKMDLNGKNIIRVFDKSYNNMDFIMNDKIYVYYPQKFDYQLRTCDSYLLCSVNLNTKEIINYNFPAQ